MANSIDGDWKEEFMDDQNYAKTTNRWMKCQNCNYKWQSELHPNSYQECPHCKAVNNPGHRQIIFWIDINNEDRFQFE